jgi:hypothetical protein
LGSVPSTLADNSVSYKGPALNFRPAGGPLSFGLQTGATTTLEVHSSGTLVTYNDGLDSSQVQTIMIPSGAVYLSLTLVFTIAANASAKYSGGTYGVKASLDTSRPYSVCFHKAFAPATQVRQALAQVFESFVLPLHRATFAHLSEGDYLLHEFDGNLHFSFGAYTGLDQVLYAGQSSADVMKAFGSPLATFSVQEKPEIDASASLDFSVQYANHFEALLSRSGVAGRLHLYRSSQRDSSGTIKAGLTFDGNTSAKLTPERQISRPVLSLQPEVPTRRAERPSLKSSLAAEPQLNSTSTLQKRLISRPPGSIAQMASKQTWRRRLRRSRRARC